MLHLLILLVRADFGVLVVDGGAWRTGSDQTRGGFQYPDALLSDESFSAALAKAKM